MTPLRKRRIVCLLRSAVTFKTGERFQRHRRALARLKCRCRTWRRRKVALYEAARARGLDSSGLALRLGCSVRTIRRLLDVDARSRVDEVEAALRRLGEIRPLDVSVG